MSMNKLVDLLARTIANNDYEFKVQESFVSEDNTTLSHITFIYQYKGYDITITRNVAHDENVHTARIGDNYTVYIGCVIVCNLYEVSENELKAYIKEFNICNGLELLNTREYLQVIGLNKE